jgi:hypothetical protein
VQPQLQAAVPVISNKFFQGLKMGFCGCLLFINQLNLDSPDHACKGVIQERYYSADNKRQDTKNDREDNDGCQAEDFDAWYGFLESD